MKIQDFTRIIPKQGHEEWPNKLGQMIALFYQAEYQTVKKKLRTAAIIHVNSNNLQTFLEKVNKDQLVFTFIRKTALFNGFSSLVKPVKEGEPFIWIGCLTRTYKEGEKFKEADLKNDHRTVGQMLGYPDCCIDYFISTFPIDPCPIWVNLEGEIKGYPECNGMLRYFGPIITAHLSCSPTCQATREIGKTWFKVMQEIDKDLANEIYNLLTGPITWNSYHGVIQIETPYFVGLNSGLFILKKPRIIKWQGVKEISNKKTSLKLKKPKVKKRVNKS